MDQEESKETCKGVDDSGKADDECAGSPVAPEGPGDAGDAGDDAAAKGIDESDKAVE